MTDEEIQKFRELKGFNKFTGRTKYFDKLVNRLRDSKIEFQLTKDEDDGVYLRVGLPNAREKRFVTLYDKDDVKNLLSIDLENYVFIEDYLAICNYTNNRIEAIINERNIAPMRPPRLLLRKLFGTSNEEDFENGNIKIELSKDDPLNKNTIKIGPTSDVLNNLSGRFGMRRQISLTIEGILFSNHDQAANILKRSPIPFSSKSI